MCSVKPSFYYVRPVLSRPLHKWLSSSRQWDIVYGGFLHNHITHNWVVMGAIGLDDNEAESKMRVRVYVWGSCWVMLFVVVAGCLLESYDWRSGSGACT